jgi:hypothetical protein
MERRSHGSVLVLTLAALAPALQGCWLLTRSTDMATAPPPVVSPVPIPSVAAQPSSAPGELPTPERLASLLGPGDFEAVGLEGAGPPTFDAAGEPGSVYAVYAGLSGAAGGIEVDVFILPTVEDAAAMVTDPGLFSVDEATKAGMGAERAALIAEQATNDGTGQFDTLWVQKGRLVAAISIPTSERSPDQLVSLATQLLARSAADQ